jgi:hypothetical protein
MDFYSLRYHILSLFAIPLRDNSFNSCWEGGGAATNSCGNYYVIRVSIFTCFSVSHSRFLIISYPHICFAFNSSFLIFLILLLFNLISIILIIGSSVLFLFFYRYFQYWEYKFYYRGFLLTSFCRYR